MPNDRHRVLAVIPLPDRTLAALGRDYDLVYRPGGWRAVTPDDCADIEALVTNGTTGLGADRLPMLPALGLASAFGTGYEGINVVAARTRGIAVTHAPGANDDTVADHAIALALALARDIPHRDRGMRAGGWAELRKPRPTLTGASVGIVGLGRIGGKIAQRAAGFSATILYHTRSPRADCAWSHVGSLVELAERSQFLIVACPGGPATRHLINRDVLAALGRDGFLINIARGSIVDTAALIDALKAGDIAGAGLDVYESEPDIPAALLALDNLVCTPHMAGRSPQAEQMQTDILLQNLRTFFSGSALTNPVP